MTFNDQTIKTVVTTCLKTTPIIEDYLEILYLSDKLITWKSTQKIGSFQEPKKLRSRNDAQDEPDVKNRRDTPQNSNTSTISSISQIISPPKIIEQTTPANVENDNKFSVSNEKVLTERGYLAMKATSFADLVAITRKDKATTKEAVASAKMGYYKSVTVGRNKKMPLTKWKKI